MRHLIIEKNKTLCTPEDVETREEMDCQVMDAGVTLRPEAYRMVCPKCVRSERDLLIGLGGIANKRMEVNEDMRIFKTRA